MGNIRSGNVIARFVFACGIAVVAAQSAQAQAFHRPKEKPRSGPGHSGGRQPLPVKPGRGNEQGSPARPPQGRQHPRGETHPLVTPPSRPQPTSPIVRAPVRYSYVQTPVGRQYINGIVLHRGYTPAMQTVGAYFPGGVAYYPFYAPSYVTGGVAISPFGYFFGMSAPFINLGHVYVTAPQTQYVEVPVIEGTRTTGFVESRSENLLNRPTLSEVAPGLDGAVENVVTTIQRGDIEAVVPLLDPRAEVAIYLKGKYRYSLPGIDFAELVRDAIPGTSAASLQLLSVRQQGPNAYSVSGIDSYRDAEGIDRSVYMSFALENTTGTWALTQFGTAPSEILPWQ